MSDTCEQADRAQNRNQRTTHALGLSSAENESIRIILGLPRDTVNGKRGKE